jgi:hypothetical protein
MLRHAPVDFPGAWLFVLGIILLVVLILARVYGRRGH